MDTLDPIDPAYLAGINADPDFQLSDKEKLKVVLANHVFTDWSVPSSWIERLNRLPTQSAQGEWIEMCWFKKNPAYRANAARAVVDGGKPDNIDYDVNLLHRVGPFGFTNAPYVEVKYTTQPELKIPVHQTWVLRENPSSKLVVVRPKNVPTAGLRFRSYTRKRKKTGVVKTYKLWEITGLEICVIDV